MVGIAANDNTLRSGSEDQITKSVEAYTAAIPTSSYLGVAAGAMALSLICQVTGRGKWGNFIAQWVPTWLMFGVYNKLLKLEGHENFDRGAIEPLGDYSCAYCNSNFSLQTDLENHQKHCSAHTTVS